MKCCRIHCCVRVSRPLCLRLWYRSKCFVPVTHLDQGGFRPLDSCPWRLCAPHNLRYQTVSNSVFTESMAQPWLSRPDTAHGLGEASTTMADRDLQSVGWVGPHPFLAHPGRQNLSRKHPSGIIGHLVFEYHPGRPRQFPGHRPDRNHAIGPGLFAFMETVRQRFKADREMRRL